MIPLFCFFRSFFCVVLFVLFERLFYPLPDFWVVSELLAGFVERQFPLRPRLVKILVLPDPLEQRVTHMTVPDRVKTITVPVFPRTNLVRFVLIPCTLPVADKAGKLDVVRPVAQIRLHVPEQKLQNYPVPDRVFETDDDANVLLVPSTCSRMPALHAELQ